ncbi:MAG: class I SAM-dependent methyltransferase [Proteobacteria bacterium]|nr:class I SAM-dependent methyltransferase [Pseudomonadota bacterium]MBU1059416.1 class I SAM-dependent methyltransferase [Pseudomonadota bacterium]
MVVLYRDEKWLVVNKPSGLSTHRAHEGDLGVVEWLHLYHDLPVHICSRLDKGTSGVLVFALTAEAAAEAQAIHEEDKSEKTYFFIANKSSHTSWICSQPLENKPCETHFNKVREGTVYALYQAVIHRGRTHQIRRHAAASHIPLLGDEEYGGPIFPRLCLHCGTVNWPGIEHSLEAGLPEWFAACLDGPSEEVTAQALAEKRWPFLSSVTNCCRLIHRGEYGTDIAIDKYGDWLCVTGFDESLSAAQLLDGLRTLLATLSRLCCCRGGVIKTNRRDPHKNKLFADLAAWGEPVPESFVVQENGLHFRVSLNPHQHVGLFLDQRDSRSRICRAAKGKRVANLFAFTCSFSVCSLAAGAEVVFSVDLAAGCLNRGKENIAINQLPDLENGKFVKEDVRKWLARQLRKKHNKPESYIHFDLVVCDPPVFASAGRGNYFHVEKEWPTLAHDVYEILGEGGKALFANNHQNGPERFYYNTLTKLFPQVTRFNSPLDFPQMPGRQAHVHIYWCQK